MGNQGAFVVELGKLLKLTRKVSVMTTEVKHFFDDENWPENLLSHSQNYNNSASNALGGNDYLEFVNRLFTDTPSPKKDFNGYDLRFYDDFESMMSEILQLNKEFGLSRLLAGFAWEYKSKKKPELFDIDIDGHQLRWNQTVKDWVNSPNSANEVGSIHTIQGYDLNYAGVIIGNDLGYDTINQKIVFNRKNYFDAKGKENNKVLGIKYSDDDILKYVINIYRVLLTRGIKGTFIYVCDPELREVISAVFA